MSFSIMKNSNKAALLSALVFPGAGHFFLKRYISGVILVCISIAGLYSIVATSIEKALIVAEQIQNSHVILNAAQVMELVSQQILDTEAQQMNIALAALLFAWIVSIIDAYRVGRVLDRKSIGT